MKSSISCLTAIGLVLGVAGAGHAQADKSAAIETASAPRILDTLTVIGFAGGKAQVGGSVDYLDAEALELQGHTDVLRALRVVPGVNIQEEEGYGLRPNIGLRGSGSDRNSRITVLEDGVPIAPAVYASPSAYYFPAFGRINSVEVTKGPGVIQYGPRTTGGALHLFSTPVPDQMSGRAEFLAGDYGRQRLHAYAGGRTDLWASGVQAGILIETFQDQADGFLRFQTGGSDKTGFDVSDYVIKAGLYGEHAPMPWSLELKYQQKDEVSDQTYLGLTQADFDADPFRLYDAARNDQMRNDNELVQLTARIDLTPNLTFTGIAYTNNVSRNWYKMQGVNAAGGGGSGDVDLSSILDDPITYRDEYDLLRGVASLDNSLVIRANNRSYTSEGFVGALDADISLGGMAHNVTAGIRLHKDAEDRFQKEDAYRLQNSALLLTSAGAAGSQTNRIAEAEAISLYMLDQVQVTDRLQITGGVRFEDYEVINKTYATSDPSRSARPTGTVTTNDDVTLFSLAALYDVNASFSVLAGVHQGFSPAGANGDPDVENEESLNIEAGARYAQGALSLEAIAFQNDYSNLLGECTNSSGGGCTPGDVFNGDAVMVRGVELTGSWDAAGLFNESDLSLPLTASLTLTDSEFQTSFESEFFGSVAKGDELIYVPDTQFTLGAGYQRGAWGVNALVNYVSEARATPGQGAIPQEARIDARTLVDLSAYYDVSKAIRLKIKAENLFDETYLAARRPSGLRPGKPREVLFGVAVTF